jgi:hypothetical protein
MFVRGSISLLFVVTKGEEKVAVALWRFLVSFMRIASANTTSKSEKEIFLGFRDIPVMY